MTEVSVVVPTYCESQTIAGVVSDIRDELSHLDAEVVVVDDDSPDGTADVVGERWGTEPDVRLQVRPDGDDLAGAVLDGMALADGRYIVVMDGDGQHPPSSIEVLLARLDDGADLAVGSRRSETGRVADSWPMWRRVVSHGGTALARAAVPPARELTDPMSGFFAVRADVVDSVRDRLRPRGYKILLELVARCPVDDVREAGYSFRRRQGGGSNMDLQTYLEFVDHLARLAIPARRSTDVQPRDATVPEVDD